MCTSKQYKVWHSRPHALLSLMIVKIWAHCTVLPPGENGWGINPFPQTFIPAFGPVMSIFLNFCLRFHGMIRLQLPIYYECLMVTGVVVVLLTKLRSQLTKTNSWRAVGALVSGLIDTVTQWVVSQSSVDWSLRDCLCPALSVTYWPPVSPGLARDCIYKLLDEQMVHGASSVPPAFRHIASAARAAVLRC